MWTDKIRFLKMGEGDLEAYREELDDNLGYFGDQLRGLERWYGYSDVLEAWFDAECVAWICYHGKHPEINGNYMNRMLLYRNFLMNHLAEIHFREGVISRLEDHSDDKDTKVY